MPETLTPLAAYIAGEEEEDALGGELGILSRPDGGHSSEISLTVTDPRLNQGRPTNIPSLIRGQVGVEDPGDGGQPERFECVNSNRLVFCDRVLIDQ